MGLSVCPAAIVAAPVETVWSLLMDPAAYGPMWDVRVERVLPEGHVTAGQIIEMKARGLGRDWSVTFKIGQVDVARHTLDLDAAFPLGIGVHEHLVCTPVDALSCRVQYG